MKHGQYTQVGKVLQEGIHGDAIDFLQMVEDEEGVKIVIDLQCGEQLVIKPSHVEEVDEADFFFTHEHHFK